MAITVKTVSVTYGRKINLGDYNSATVDCTIWADVDGENLDQDMADLWDMAKANVKAQVLPLMSKNNGNGNMQKAFLGLPVHEQAGDGWYDGIAPENIERGGN